VSADLSPGPAAHTTAGNTIDVGFILSLTA
jgi:hypothetical protein